MAFGTPTSADHRLEINQVTVWKQAPIKDQISGAPLRPGFAPRPICCQMLLNARRADESDGIAKHPLRNFRADGRPATRLPKPLLLFGVGPTAGDIVASWSASCCPEITLQPSLGRRFRVRYLDAMRILHFSTLIMASAFASISLADSFIGQASIVDGDTIEIHGTRIRLWGIDAPESAQLCRGDDSLAYRCGAEAANQLDTFIARRPVNCSPINLDRYGRTVATCEVAGIDLGEWLVGNGLALDWPQYSSGRYARVQQQAEQAGRGIWRGSYVEPWRYRVCTRAGGRPSECSDDANARP